MALALDLSFLKNFSIKKAIIIGRSCRVNAKQRKPLLEKADQDETLDSSIEKEILQRGINRELPCVIAFEIAKDLGTSADRVGKTADLLNIKLTRCQLGLFGYQPQKKMVTPVTQINPDVKDAVLNALVDEKLSCKNAWDIASRLKVAKITVSSTCETLNIKIKPCQLGAF
jgi:hypothetical protein